jgi:hypothetical protein
MPTKPNMKDDKRKSLTIRKHKKSDQRGKGKSLTGKEAQIIQGNNAVEHFFGEGVGL